MQAHLERRPRIAAARKRLMVAQSIIASRDTRELAVKMACSRLPSSRRCPRPFFRTIARSRCQSSERFATGRLNFPFSSLNCQSSPRSFSTRTPVISLPEVECRLAAPVLSADIPHPLLGRCGACGTCSSRPAFFAIRMSSSFLSKGIEKPSADPTLAPTRIYRDRGTALGAKRCRLAGKRSAARGRYTSVPPASSAGFARGARCRRRPGLSPLSPSALENPHFSR
jgi:hypothetical protein